MPQTSSIEPSEFRLKPSRALRLANLSLMVLLLALGGVALSGLTLTFWAALLLLAGWHLDSQLRQCSGVASIRFDADGWSLCDASGACNLVHWHSSTAVLSVAVALRWRDGWHWRGLLITADMLGDADYRRLCRLLWQSPAMPAPTAL